MEQTIKLTEAPRKVPFTTSLKILFGGFTNQIGWPIFGLGMVFFWVFSLDSDLMNLGKFSGQLETTKGKITAVRATGAIVNGKDVEEYTFEYKTKEGTFEGQSYSREIQFRKGNNVIVEYVANNHAFSRIKGLRSAEYGLATGVLPLVVPLLGLVMVFIGFTGGLKTKKLLVHGYWAFGKMKGKIATGREINDQVVYKMNFGFRGKDGKEYTTVAYTHETHLLEDEDMELLLYNPDDPKDSMMFDSMPGNPERDENGEILAVDKSVAFGALFIPFLAIVGNTIYMIVLFNS
ncbi:DUF3592 domain-containing protein [Flexithrix dorotheae]|uniref:DUF3592 domain-containing protein n=1 Tax=Flexithrix dorotheae TaxID=70993 RepID=UPI0003822238|nr:DUF3592 domain-containing protein [Flexithrix dorotheae]